MWMSRPADFFSNGSRTLQHKQTLQTTSNLIQQSQAVDLAQAIRSRGYLAATLDPLGTKPVDDPTLHPDFYNLTENELRQITPVLGLWKRICTFCH